MKDVKFKQLFIIGGSSLSSTWRMVNASKYKDFIFFWWDHNLVNKCTQKKSTLNGEGLFSWNISYWNRER